MGFPGEKEHCEICNIWWINSVVLTECPLCSCKENEYDPDVHCVMCTYETDLDEVNEDLEDLRESYSELEEEHAKLVCKHEKTNK